MTDCIKIKMISRLFRNSAQNIDLLNQGDIQRKRRINTFKANCLLKVPGNATPWSRQWHELLSLIDYQEGIDFIDQAAG